MTSFDDIPGLAPDLVPVLQTAGIDTPADLAVVPAKVIRRAIEKAMDGKGPVPSVFEVEGWQSAVKAGLRPEVRMRASQNHVTEPSGSEYSFSDSLPVAEALSSRQLMDSGIPASAVPVARILGDPSDANLLAPKMTENERLELLLHPSPLGRERPEQGEEVTEEVGAGPAERVLPGKKRVEVKTVEPSLLEPLPKVKSVEEAEEGEGNAQVSIAFPSTEERSREETDFERKNRGMTHKDPMRVLRGALATLMALVLTIVGVGTVVSASVMEFVLKKPVPVEMAFGLLAFPLALFIFLWQGAPARCRLCGQRLFMPRSCRRHERAHNSILGYSLSLAAHVVTRRWFRCSLCGTKQRLKQ